MYRLAKQYQQYGWVINSSQGVQIHIEGCLFQQQQFLSALQSQLPPFANIDALSIQAKTVQNFNDFQIKSSQQQGSPSPFVLPDISPCPDCIGELFNPDSRFYHYPFISCCHCGPRYSIMQQQPYDRLRTSMAAFKACTDCLNDYRTPENRRFHSQTIACKQCGPQLQFLNSQGQNLHTHHDALLTAIDYLKQGKIIAIKGVGGFQLLVDATQEKAISLLRQRKHRPAKPFAVMLKDFNSVQTICDINTIEQQALTSSASPIVLLKQYDNHIIAENVAPNNTYLGVMLPASPLHHLLAKLFNKPLIVTSGNRADEPLCTTNQQALENLADIADGFLVHNRDIIHGLDDSVVRCINHKMVSFRRARGYVPLPITLQQPINEMIAMGGQTKNTLAISQGKQLILSQHLGDLSSFATQQHFQQTLQSFTDFYQITAKKIIHDYHPDYFGSHVARQQNLPTLAIQHHHAHILACMAEHHLQPPVLGFAWDGTGLGEDNTAWGGECLLLTADKTVNRVAHSRPFPLIGGDKVAHEPRRAALAVLYEIYGEALFNDKRLQTFLAAFSSSELMLLQQMLVKQLNCPRTSSIGRLFDAVASLLGICDINQFEGQAAMQLEQLAEQSEHHDYYALTLRENQPIIIDWQPIIIALLTDLTHLKACFIAKKFHNTLAEIVLAIALRSQQKIIILSGGCFQNAILTETCINKLETGGFSVYTHEKIPPNDGGLALGQLYSQTDNPNPLRDA